MSTTIVLVDDHTDRQRGLHLLLESEPNFQVIRVTGEETELSEILEGLRSGVLVLDMMTSRLRGLENVRQICNRYPETRILYFSLFGNIACVVEDGTTGPKAYFLEKPTSEGLVRTIREVIAGRQQLTSTRFKKVADIEDSKKANLSRLDPYESLTRREREVLHLVGEGLSSAEIARRLVISSRTVDMHRWHIMRKLRLRGQAALARYAIHRGLASYGD